MTEIERLIEVAHIADPLGCDVDEEGIKTVYGKIVRAILQAMREPNEEALIASLKKRYPHNLYAWERLPPQRQAELLEEMRGPFQAVIDHILSETP